MKWVLVLCLVALGACRASIKADAELCEAILDRTIDLELDAMGYHHDQVLAALKRKQLRETLHAQLQSCIGRAAPAHALRCVRGAQSSGELTHDCLALDLDERTEHTR